MTEYNPADWYWIVAGNSKKPYSSKSNSYIGADDIRYKAFLANGNYPTRISSFDELKEVLKAAQVPPYLSATPRQVRLVLQENNLLDTVDAALKSADEESQISWEYSTVVDRDNPLLKQLASSLGISDAQIDAMFARAVTL